MKEIAFPNWAAMWRSYNRTQDVRLWRLGLMKAKEYDVLVRAVEEGLRCGIRRMLKHRETYPDIWGADREEVIGELTDHVVSGICDWFDFDSEPLPAVVWPPPDEAA